MAKTVTHNNNEPYLGDRKLTELAKEKSFSELVYFMLSGDLPGEKELSVFEKILALSIDHGEETPSAKETIKHAKAGKTISESVSAGISQINDVHGGAIEPAMDIFYSAFEKSVDPEALVDEYLSNRERLPGFGHRIYDADPRAGVIFESLRGISDSKKYIDFATRVEEVLSEKKGRPIPINIDGAIAVALCSFGWDSKLGKAVFIIARTPGLCVQYLNAIE